VNERLNVVALNVQHMSDHYKTPTRRATITTGATYDAARWFQCWWAKPLGFTLVFFFFQRSFFSFGWRQSALAALGKGGRKDRKRQRGTETKRTRDREERNFKDKNYLKPGLFLFLGIFFLPSHKNVFGFKI